MQRKPTPIFVLDTHAGIGRYDLDRAPAQRSGEWRAGVGRLLEDTPQALEGYVGLVRELGLYPGSPALVRALLRPADRLVCCELHPDDVACLRRHFAGDPQVAVHFRDGWEALGALLPPAEKRGLILIDPAYEQPNEFARLAAGLCRGSRRFRNGVFAAWYPVKHRAPVRAFHAELRDSGLRDVVAAELLVREPTDPARLNGCGLIVVNPPYGFEDAAPLVLSTLLERLGDRERGECCRVLRVVDE